MRTMIWQVSVAALLVSCSIAATAWAQEITPRCPTPSSTVLLNLLRRTPDAVILELRGNEAKVAIRIFNQLPPAGDESGDRFYIAFAPGISVSRLLVGSHGCIEMGAVVDVHTAVSIDRAAKHVDAGISL